MRGFTARDIAALNRQLKASGVAVESVSSGPKRSKYGAVKTVVDGIRFDSRREADHYISLKAQRAAGEILWFIRRPVFDLPGGVRYIADFLVVKPMHPDGDPPGLAVEVHDVKGFLTQTYKLKKKQTEALYGISIIEV